MPMLATMTCTLWKTSRIARTRFSPWVFIARISPNVRWIYSPKGAFQITRVMCRNVGANRPSFSSPRPCLATLARHCDQITSETVAGSKPSLAAWWPLLDSAVPVGIATSSSGSSAGSVFAARANSLTNEQIFFCPMPGVLVNSENGVRNRSSKVLPKKASGSRRSVGSAQ